MKKGVPAKRMWHRIGLPQSGSLFLYFQPFKSKSVKIYTVHKKLRDAGQNSQTRLRPCGAAYAGSLL